MNQIPNLLITINNLNKTLADLKSKLVLLKRKKLENGINRQNTESRK
jgi:hypothetical protein